MAQDDWAHWPVVGEQGYIGSPTFWVYSGVLADFNSWIARNPQMIPFPITNVLRSTPEYQAYTGLERGLSSPADYWEYWWFGGLANGSQIAPGKYEMRVSTLIPFSDPENTNSWQTWTAPFGVAAVNDS